MSSAAVRLLVVAAPAEAQAVLRAFDRPDGPADIAWRLHPLDEGHDLVVCGIGKANAAGAVASVAADRHGLVLSVGVAGALPHLPRGAGTKSEALPLGTVISATSCTFAEEGLQEPNRFLDCAQLGFPLAPDPFDGNGATVPSAVRSILEPLADAAGVVATVSTCSGTDALARLVADRTGARAEAMEGAAVALAAVRLGMPFGELRVISNTTGDRSRQRWDLHGALSRLTAVIGRLRSLG